MDNVMTNEEAINTLTAVNGIFNAMALTDDNELIKTLASKMTQASSIAIDAIKLLDDKLNIEEKNDDNE